MNRMYSITEAAEVLNVPVSWLRRQVTAREIPHARLGRHIRFTEAHLAAIVAEGERRAALAMPAQTSPTGRLRRRHPAAPAP